MYKHFDPGLSHEPQPLEQLGLKACSNSQVKVLIGDFFPRMIVAGKAKKSTFYQFP